MELGLPALAPAFSRSLAMARMALVERVEVACALVNSAQCEETRLEYSGKQTAAIMSLFRATPQLELAPKILSLADLLKGGNFAEHDHKEMITFLSESVDSTPPKPSAVMAGAGEDAHRGGTRTYQDFTSIGHFFTKTQIEAATGSPDCMQVVVGAADSLGLRIGSEPTKRALTAWALLFSEGFEKSNNYSSNEVKPMYEAMKRVLKRTLSKGPMPIKDLPTSPDRLAQVEPALYAKVYGHEAPALCPFSLPQYEAIATKIRCRGNDAAPRRPVLQLDTSRAGAMDSNIAGVASVFMQGMKDMQEMQWRILETLSGKGRSLAPALEDGGARDGVTVNLGNCGLRSLRSSSSCRAHPPVFPPLASELDEEAERKELEEEAKRTELKEEATRKRLDDERAEAAAAAQTPLAEVAVVAPPAPDGGESSASKRCILRTKTKFSGYDAIGVVLAASAKPPKAARAAGAAMKRPAGGTGQPLFSVEWSREQVMCRSGRKGPGESHRIAFSEHGGLEGAVAEAKKWVSEKRRKLELD
jgi:hypothetical protein